MFVHAFACPDLRLNGVLAAGLWNKPARETLLSFLWMRPGPIRFITSPEPYVRLWETATTNHSGNNARHLALALCVSHPPPTGLVPHEADVLDITLAHSTLPRPSYGAPADNMLLGRVRLTARPVRMALGVTPARGLSYTSISRAPLQAELTAPNGRTWTQPLGLFVNNKFVESSNGQTITTTDP